LSTDKQDSQIGSCIAGQTIKNATKNVLKREYFKKDIIINLGSVDLMNEHGLRKMKYDFRQLITALQNKGVYEPTVTTLAPLVNRSLSSFILHNHEKFNDFLYNNYSNVINLNGAMLNHHNEPDFRLYAP
jgi:hypothetical protein